MSKKKKKKTQFVPQYGHKNWKDIYTSKWFWPLVGVFVFVFILSLRFVFNLDIGFHLRGGQWMLEHMSFHQKDIFTYTVNQNEYIAMYWLYQIMLFVVYTIIGYKGLTIMNALLISFVFYMIFLRMNAHRIPLWLSTVSIFLAACSMQIRFTVRPDIATWIFLVLMLYVLDQYFYHKKKYLFWLVIIQVLWVNFHGLFILGWVIMGAYFISSWIDNRKVDKTLLKWCIIAVAVCLLNPYLFKGIAFPFYLFTRLQNSSIFKYLISEFMSPWSKSARQHMPLLPLYFYYFLSSTKLFAPFKLFSLILRQN